MTENKDRPPTEMMMLGIGTVFFSISLAMMSKKERIKLSKKYNVSDEELDAYLLNIFVKHHVERGND